MRPSHPAEAELYLGALQDIMAKPVRAANDKDEVCNPRICHAAQKGRECLTVELLALTIEGDDVGFGRDSGEKVACFLGLAAPGIGRTGFRYLPQANLHHAQLPAEPCGPFKVILGNQLFGGGSQPADGD